MGISRFRVAHYNNGRPHSSLGPGVRERPRVSIRGSLGVPGVTWLPQSFFSGTDMREVTKRRRRQTPAADSDVEREAQDLPDSGANAGREPVPAESKFFDYLDSLTAEQWEDRTVYIYRQHPPVRNPGNGHYIEKIPRAIDQEYIRAQHGGGRYLVFVKNVSTKGRERSQSVVIEGAPRLLEAQTLIDARTKQAISSPASHCGSDDRTIADVVAKAITAVQSQKIPAEVAIKVAMETLGAAQKAALDLLLSAAKPQADIVHELLLGDGDNRRRPFASHVGGLLVQAAERAPQVIDSVAAGLDRLLNSAGSLVPLVAAQTRPSAPPLQSAEPTAITTPPAAPVRPRREFRPFESPDLTPRQPVPESQPVTESQLLDAILLAIADGYSAGHKGDAVAHTIRTRYPAAISTMQKYLAMDDLLVLMWMRQQPATAEIATHKEFPRYYAELKSEFI